MCRKLGYTCPGYISSLVIVPFQPAGKSAPSKGTEWGKSDPRALAARRAMPVGMSMLTPDPVSISREYFLRRLVGSDPLPQRSGIPSLLCAFLDRALSVGSFQYECTKALTVSYHSMTALGSHGSAAGEAMKAYSHALRAVWKAIDQDSTTGPDILMSIMCLCLYENIVVTEPRSWIKHYKGISHLIEINGPEHYRNGRNRDILLAFRYTIIVSAGTLHQPCFLAEERWRKAMELTEDESRDILDTLLNIAVDIPGLLHGLNHLKDDRLLDRRNHAILKRSLEQTLTSLQQWQDTSFFRPNANNTSPPGSIAQTAPAIAFHHMALLLLEELCYLLEVPWLPSSPPLSGVIAGLDRLSTAHTRAQRKHALASEILSLAQRSIGDDTGVYGVLRFIMPLHVAHDHLLPASPETDAIGNLMNTVMAGQHGFYMARRHEGMYTSLLGSSSTT
ncbi:hypothetical protein BDV38DRAFT_287604 [Aspergillus pseudotamarii]|uniref:Fungal-specific transcription factor domain-containing protein n=1 Tax=Aspergillus pseudotamarii TaxID=132259 RepID=A0A5N6SCW9_ASPPS|nr:uncharacterized protein BDV38DRAFT_287604 [Aspergillus pseudotamarii]KAE8132568.1 hypothetical protein BDV38DRAFT_287604 [Aspergillus pseudotamarii]